MLKCVQQGEEQLKNRKAEITRKVNALDNLTPEQRAKVQRIAEGYVQSHVGKDFADPNYEQIAALARCLANKHPNPAATAQV